VVVHPQSVIHSMVEFEDGSVLAQMGTPDMRTPIAYSLGYPERIDGGSAPVDFLRLSSLTFEEPDLERFPCLALAYRALDAGGSASIVLNAANEVAVQAFLEQRIAFTDIATVIHRTLDSVAPPPPRSVAEVVEIDTQARRSAQSLVQRPGLTMAANAR